MSRQPLPLCSAMVVQLPSRDWPAGWSNSFAVKRRALLVGSNLFHAEHIRAQHGYDYQSDVCVISRTAHYRPVVRQGCRLIIQKRLPERSPYLQYPSLKT